MKKIIYTLGTALLLSVTSSCNFLDVVPDEAATEQQAFATARAAEQYLYSCYSFMPNPRAGVPSSLDAFTGDEVITAFEHETFAKFPKGNFTASDPVISYWNTLFGGIKQCYILKNNIDKVPNLEPSKKEDYRAQADFLIAYFHYLQLRCYGPIILVKEEPKIDTPAELYLGRTPLDESVEWVAALFDNAAGRLPARREGTSFGLATSVAAKALKARLYLLAASPLFNGNPDYAGFKNLDGASMIPTNFDANKWTKAKIAYKEAIDLAEANGYRLYATTDTADPSQQEPTNPTERVLRFNITDKFSKETIWADTRQEGPYELQNKARPHWEGRTWNGVAPTLTMLDRFYTKNGLPLQEDTNLGYSYSERFNVVDIPAGTAYAEPGQKTSQMNMDREPRYYAWISFHNGYYETKGTATDNNANKEAYQDRFKRGTDKAKILTQFMKNDNCGKKGRVNNYSPSGFLVKKGVMPKLTQNANNSGLQHYPWPVIRLTELYLGYAEACIESGDLAEAKRYIDPIRTRAGIPTVDAAWATISVVPDQTKMREIIRQERQIELFLENQNFWDMRRWKLAGHYFNVLPRGLNVEATSIEAFSKETELSTIIRKFESPTHYLLPIPQGEVQVNRKLVQNPGY
ncbi:RagB/SusD family nutrient uptake outer membrane protein [Capnocytophaga sp.]|uniref:RagB/SusD family nutrient uptake outer membrane protein n=1 Tax=Capnocytophaga sp. TaxID=44737 RepID=UPI0026DB890E|nr:RagB/SusD family nutrient uptake outer membrane protein [Capnocytophaga sp.]MDO5105660.1 RagB/SusD family nutrient uptake outer membrane protein [Capnocytophaga sp.]